MTIFWSRSLKGVHGTWKTPGFAFLAPLLVELQPTLGVIFGIIAVFRGPQRGTWGPHGRPRALSLPFGMSRPGLAPIWSQFNPRSQPHGGPKTVKIVICDKTPFFSDPAPGRTSGNRGNIEKQVPRPSEEGHGARSGESDVGRCGQAACVVTAVYSSTAVGACPRTK